MTEKKELKQEELKKVNGGNGVYTIDANACIRCGQCKSVCPVGCIVCLEDGTYCINSKKCIGCGCCKGVCPACAIA